MNNFDLELIQDKYTSLIFYDGGDRCKDNDYISLKNINRVDIIFKNIDEIQDNNIIYRFDNTKKAYVVGYRDFTPYDYSEYNSTGTLNIIINDINASISINENVTSIEQMINILNNSLNQYNVFITNEGNKIVASLNYSDDNNYIKIINGTILKNIGWNFGTYRSNSIKWNSDNVTQDNFNLVINYNDLYTYSEIPETYFDIEYNITYNDNNVENVFSSNFIEFTYKQTEIYRAKIFEYISRNFDSFLKVEQREQTDMELFLQKSIYFDAVYKSFLSSLEIGDFETSNKVLYKLKEFKQLNEIL